MCIRDRDTEAFAEYKKCENSYNAYVYDQYLQVPDSLKQMLTKVLASDSDEKDSENVTSHISYEEANTRITGYLNENITYTEETVSYTHLAERKCAGKSDRWHEEKLDGHADRHERSAGRADKREWKQPAADAESAVRKSGYAGDGERIVKRKRS